jgi:hypothetical protein
MPEVCEFCLDESVGWRAGGRGTRRLVESLAWAPRLGVHSSVGATLVESPDEHHWVLLDHQVTSLVVDATSFRVQTWSLDASAEIRCAAPFILRQASGAERVLDPTDSETLAPILALVRRRLESITVTRDGELTAAFSGGLSLVVARRRGLLAWEVQGGGSLEGMSYRAALPTTPLSL